MMVSGWSGPILQERQKVLQAHFLAHDFIFRLPKLSSGFIDLIEP